MFDGLIRAGDLRRRITRCWRMSGFSASNRARLVSRGRIANSGSEGRPSAASLPYAHPHVIPDKVFARRRA